MYKVSPTIIELLNKNYRQIVKISVSGKNGNFVITESEILQGSLQIDRYCVSGSKIEVGSAIAAELSFDLKNDNGKYDNTVFEGAELYVQIGIKDWTVTGTTPTYWIPCGHFIIDTPPRHKTIIKVSALDRMMLFDRLVDRSRLSFPMTVEDLLSRICSICGVTMVSNLTKLVNRTYTIKECPEDASITYRTLLQWVEDLLSRICSICGVTMVSNLTKLVNRTYTIKECPEDASITYRTLLQWCTALMGACAFMNSDGNLEIKWYEPTGITITPSERYDSDMYENDISISGVYFKDNEEGKEYIAGSDSYCLDLSGNELIQGYQQLVVDTLYVALKDFAYRPYEASVKPMPYLYPMDKISYVDSKGVTHSTIVTNVNFVMNQNTKIAGKGETAQNEMPYLYPMDKISYVDSKGVTHSTIVTNVNFVMNQNTKIAGKGETAQNESYDKNNGLTKQQAAILEVIRKKVESGITSREQAALEMNRLLANSMGLYRTEVKQDDGSTKYYFHDGQTPETSNIIYTFQANGFAWTKHWNNGNPIWEYGMTKDGNALMNVLAAYKITADYIEVGSITADKIATSYKESVTTQIEKTVDGKLVNYVTTTDMQSAIKQASDSITTSVSKTYVTTTTFDKDMNTVKGHGKLVNYVTTTDMQSAIKQASDSITTSVSKTYVTTTTFDKDMNTVKGQASNALTQASNANNRINGIEQNYATKVEMKSQIQQTAESINSTVSKKVGKDEIISAINQTAESVKIKANHIELTGNVTISALSQDALNTIKGYSNQALTDAKNYTEQQLNSVKSDTGNLLKGYNFTQSDISNYWVTSGSILYGIADPAGGMNAVRVMGTGSDNFISAKRSNNQAIYNTGRYRVSVWLKSNMNRTIKISFNRVTHDCALTNTWKQFTFVQQVNSIQSSYELFTIGGWGSIGANVAVWAFKPEVTFEMTSLDYFNALTNNGETQGLYLSNGKIYINGNYIQAKSISAGKIQVSDLSAFRAKIGGWSIGSNYLRSSNGNVNLYSDGRINIGVATISSYSNAITIKYGLHVYNNTDQFNDGSGYIKFFGLPHVTSGGHLVFNRDGASLAYLSSSSRRYKDPVSDMSVSEAEKILDIPVVWFKYKDGYLRYDDVLAGKAIPGFYAEDVETYYPVAVQRNEDGSVEDWNYRMMIPAMLKLIQELYKRTGGIKSE